MRGEVAMTFRSERARAGGVRAHGDFPDSTPRENTGTEDHFIQTRSAYPYGLAYLGSDDSFGSGVASAVTFLAGVWLVISPFVLDLGVAGGEAGVYWNDVAIGIVIGLLALVRAMAPREVPWFSVVNVVLGVWLIVTPWVLGYNVGAGMPTATLNNTIVGALVVIAAGVSAALTYSRRARIRDEARAAGRHSAAAAE